jgi:hypothetical protein
MANGTSVSTDEEMQEAFCQYTVLNTNILVVGQFVFVRFLLTQSKLRRFVSECLPLRWY